MITKVSTETLRKQVARSVGKSCPSTENQDAPTVKAGHTGHKISPVEIVEEVEKRVRKGKSIRETEKKLLKIVANKIRPYE